MYSGSQEDGTVNRSEATSKPFDMVPQHTLFDNSSIL